MGGRRRRVRETEAPKSQTLPSSPSHSTSSSDFEFTITNSPLKSSSTHLCPADELFYKGQLLPLHLSPRLSMVRTLLLTSPSSSSSSDTTSASRDSTGSSNSSISSDLILLSDLESARPSSATEEDVFKHVKKPSTTKYFSFSRAKEVMRKCFKKVKPLYEKLSQKQDKKVVENRGLSVSCSVPSSVSCPVSKTMKLSNGVGFSNSFTENLRYPRRKRCVSSCPSSMRSSPTRSYGVLRSEKSFGSLYGSKSSSASSMEELQNAIQGAIAHCKNSMGQKEI